MEHYLKRVGFFGGTFDPIHFGHLNLAINLLENKQLDQILFCPANVSPEKAIAPPLTSKEDRKAMLQLAIEDVSEFSLIDTELNRKGLSYTIDTISGLKKANSHIQYYLILGEDVLSGLSKWKNIHSLFKLASPLVGTRSGVSMPAFDPEIEKAISAGRVDIPSMEISSTQLRQRLLEKKYCGHLIPAKVLDYIYENRLY